MKSIFEKVRGIFNRELTLRKLCFLTAILSLLVICVVYYINRITPFGKNTLLQVDFYHQYGPMLAELYDRIHNFSSLLYSFKMGLGLPLFRNFLNYMSSPFNIIMLFFRRKDILTSYSVIIGLKAVFSSVAMVYYLSKKYKATELYLVPFGLFYAFSAYYSAYYWNLMWIDGMVFLPLITLGIEKLVNDGKWKFYTIWLAIMLLSNYYIGYMICIFSCLYYLIYSFNKTVLRKGQILSSFKKFIKSGLMFGFSSLLSFGLVAIFLVPLCLSISSISATGKIDIPNSQYYAFIFSDFFKYHFSGIASTVFASDAITAPNVSCGILSLALLIIFIVNVDVSIREKICYVILLGFFAMAFFNAPLDYILQGFHVPNDLPYRYSFIYSFILILISVYAFRNIKKVSYRMMILIYVFLSIVLIMIGDSEYVSLSGKLIYINMVLLGIYFILYSAVYTKKINLKVLYVFMIFLAIFDVIVSINKKFNVNVTINSFYDDYGSISNSLNYIDKVEDDLFYRVEKEKRITLNDTSWYDYYGITSFSSMNNEDMAILQYNLGMEGNVINSYIYRQSTPVYDTMFDIKYFIGNSVDNKRYTLINDNDNKIYRYNYNVGIGYAVNKEIDSWNTSYNDPFKIQNEYMNLATGVDNVLEQLKVINKELIYQKDNYVIVKYTLANSFDNLYFYNNNEVDFVILNDCLYYSNDNYRQYNDVINNLYYMLVKNDDKYMLNFKLDEKVIDIYLGYSNLSNDYSVSLYTINDNNFLKAISKLKSNILNVTSFKETKIKGNITVNNDMVMYTSIPYDEGWHVLVDGKKVKTRALAKSLLIFDIPNGSHDVIIYYKEKGLILGIFISIMSILLFFSDKIIKKIKHL